MNNPLVLVVEDDLVHLVIGAEHDFRAHVAEQRIADGK